MYDIVISNSQVVTCGVHKNEDQFIVQYCVCSFILLTFLKALFTDIDISVIQTQNTYELLKPHNIINQCLLLSFDIVMYCFYNCRRSILREYFTHYFT